MGPPQPSLQLDSDTLEQINSQLASSRPPTAFHDAQALDQLLPPKRDLPFSKPAAKKPRTSRKQTNKTSVENGSTGMIAAITRQAVLLTKTRNYRHGSDPTISTSTSSRSEAEQGPFSDHENYR